MELRAERDQDHGVVGELHRQAFGSQGDVVVTLVEALRRDDPGARGFVAVEDGRVAGHILFTRSLLDAPRKLVTVQVLSPVGVLPEYQRRGIGTALIRYGLAEIDKLGIPLVFLEGDPAYYSRIGFVAGGEMGFRKPSLRVPDAAFQICKMSAYEPWMTGTLVYSATFWDHDCVGLRDPAA
jgi:putative acetyltransferase